MGTGPDNAFIGCRAWNNASDGFDLYAWTSPVRIEHSWSVNQCETTPGAGIDGNGFKLGGDQISAVHELTNLVAVGNTRGTGLGFTEDTNPESQSCAGTCAAWDNVVDVGSVDGVGADAIPGADVESMSADDASNADGSLKSITD